MSRLIDADEIKKREHDVVLTNGAKHRCFDTTMLYEIPTVDAVPVVRCKDCKYMTEHYDTDGSVPYWTCSEWDSGTDYDGYCHYGERREDGNN